MTPDADAPRKRKTKRANTEGSITYRPQDGRWEARLTLPDGRRKSFSPRRATKRRRSSPRRSGSATRACRWAETGG